MVEARAGLRVRARDRDAGFVVVISCSLRVALHSTNYVHRCRHEVPMQRPASPVYSPTVQRLEGLAKLTGRERYVDDLPLEEFLWGATVRSPAPRGRITSIHFDPGIDWSQFTVVDYRDVPGPNVIALIESDQPVHEAVVLLAHPDRAALRRAVAAVRIEVAPEPAVFDFRVTPRPDQIQYGPDNVLKHLRISKGDVERALAGAPIVVEGTYET